MMKFAEQFEYYRSLIEGELDTYCEIPNCEEKVIYEAMAYSLQAGGKRIRPILTLAVCDMLGGDIRAALPFAAAIEMIHTYSLIHDDLPCMDNDDMRRGKPTCHKVFGEAIAVLAGDALLTQAFGLAASNAEIVVNFADYAGVTGMIGGQVLDMLYEGNYDVSAEQLAHLQTMKTGALMKLAVNNAAILCNASIEQSEKLWNFATNLGLAFQIRDDILDFTGDATTLGKNVGMDLERGKTTFVTVLGLDGASEMLQKLTNDAIAEISYFGDKAQFLIDLTKYLLERES